MHYLILALESLLFFFFAVRFSFCILFALCFQEPPQAGNVEVHTVVMENLAYLYRYRTITVNKKQMPDQQAVFTALRRSILLGRVGWEIFFSGWENLKISFSHPNGSEVFHSKWDKRFFSFF